MNLGRIIFVFVVFLSNFRFRLHRYFFKISQKNKANKIEKNDVNFNFQKLIIKTKKVFNVLEMIINKKMLDSDQINFPSFAPSLSESPRHLR